jgi:hypothetical protein
MGLVIHDLACDRCDHREYDAGVDVADLPFCPTCKPRLRMCIRWDISRRQINVVSAERTLVQSDRAAVYVHPETGRIAYPGRVDVPMPEKYRQWGFVKKEFNTAKELDKFCKEKKLVNEKLNFNSGNGVN